MNGGIVQHHHLWRHAPECLIRMIIENQSSFSKIDNCKEDVWSIGCIIVEMMINTILFRPQNDDPALQLLRIVEFVGGLTLPIIDHFPLHIKNIFSTIKCDSHQQRLHRLLRQIFQQYPNSLNESNRKREYLYDLLKQIFQFQSEKRIDLQGLAEHPFFSMNVLNKNRMNFMKLKSQSIQIDDLIHLCVKLQLEKSRWVLTLKERCLFEVILQIKNFNQINFNQLGLRQSLQNELQQLIYFFTGN